MDCNLQRTYWCSDHNFRAYDHPIVKFFADQRVELIDEKIGLLSCHNVLDIGCGSGFSTYYLSQKVKGRTYGGDYSLKMLFAHPMKRHIMCFDALNLPFKDNQFDLVNAWEILHHIEKPEKAVSEMVRVSKKYIVIFEPNRWNIAQLLFAFYEREHRWVLRYSSKYLLNILKDCGVKNVLFYAKCGYIFPNKMPFLLFNILKNLNFLSKIGISQIVVATVGEEKYL
jgi:ubiquinone/menaquinone biosynthesis C-methylase UbiE